MLRGGITISAQKIPPMLFLLHYFFRAIFSDDVPVQFSGAILRCNFSVQFFGTIFLGAILPILSFPLLSFIDRQREREVRSAEFGTAVPYLAAALLDDTS